LPSLDACSASSWPCSAPAKSGTHNTHSQHSCSHRLTAVPPPPQAGEGIPTAPDGARLLRLLRRLLKCPQSPSAG
jgi:hypothetical protein